MTSFMLAPDGTDSAPGNLRHGTVAAGARVALVELVASPLATVRATLQRLRAAGWSVEHALVLLDTEQGECEALAADGVEVHAILRRSEWLARRASAERHAREQHS